MQPSSGKLALALSTLCLLLLVLHEVQEGLNSKEAVAGQLTVPAKTDGSAGATVGITEQGLSKTGSGKSHALPDFASSMRDEACAPPSQGKARLLADVQVRSLISGWLERFGPGLEVARGRAKRFQKRVSKATDDEEGAIHYLRLRAMQPKVVWECSPDLGFSSVYILSALLDNGNGGHLHSFGFVSHETLMKYMGAVDPALLQHWTYHQEDFKITVAKHGDFSRPASVPSDVAPAPDYVYIDAEHSAEFGRWFMTSLLAKLPGHTPVSVHDVYRCAGAGFPGGQEECTPEGLEVVNFLTKLNRSCNLFTVSSLYKPKLFAEVQQLLAAYTVGRVTKPTANPTLWFEMNC